MSDDYEFVLPQPGQQPRKLAPRFFIDIKQNPAKSKEAGRPICEEVEMIEIRVPGVVRDIFTSRVNDKWKAEYPVEYAHWKATRKQLVEGTPLRECPKLTAVRATELNLMGILTCEQLIGLTDQQKQNVGMDARKMIAEVEAWMKAAQDTALVTRQASELEQLRNDNAILKQQFEELAARVAAQEKPKRATLSIAKSE